MLVSGRVTVRTLPETNSKFAPENWWLEDWIVSSRLTLQAGKSPFEIGYTFSKGGVSIVILLVFGSALVVEFVEVALLIPASSKSDLVWTHTWSFQGLLVASILGIKGSLWRSWLYFLAKETCGAKILTLESQWIFQNFAKQHIHPSKIRAYESPLVSLMLGRLLNPCFWGGGEGRLTSHEKSNFNMMVDVLINPRYHSSGLPIIFAFWFSRS